ncbi:MAG: DUF2793 domain-containing protein [Rickettsiales bacterium]|nr:DUF2793 domain-containing protein [Rickettsiales bacterium]
MASNTGRLSLPYIAQSQSQKEVTHNEALTLLDILTQSVAIDVGLNTPPGSPTVGHCYLIGSSPTGAWSGKANYITQAQEGGVWLFMAPFTRATFWVNSKQENYSYTGSEWLPEGLLGKSTGDYLRVGYLTQDITVSGASTTSTIQIPARTIVMAVNVRVTTAVTGATTFSVGVSGDTTRYGSSIAIALDTTNIGLSSSPLAYYSNTALVLTAAGSNFTGGVVRTTIQYLQSRGPWTF